MKVTVVNKEDINITKKEIQELGLNAIKQYFNLDVNMIKPDILKFIHQRAKVAMQFEREMNLDRRAVELNYLRVFRLVAEDKKEIRKLIKKSIPRYLPD